MLNGFCLLSNPPSTTLALNRECHDTYNTNQYQMKNTCPFYILFQVLKVLLIKICKIHLADLLFLVVFISFYISRYQFFLQMFRTSFNIIWKKDFCHKFSFFNGSTQTPHPLNAQNLLSMTKVFSQFSLKDI